MKIIKGLNHKEEDISDLFKIERTSSMDAISLTLPQGVYTTFRTYKFNKVLHLDDHFDRLIESAKLAGMDIDIDRCWVRELIRNMIPQSPSSDTRIRLQVDLTNEVGAIYLLGETLKVPTDEEYRYGVWVKTIGASRINPAAKTTQNIKLINKLASLGRKTRVHEYILCDDRGNLLEGLSSNFFAVLENTIYTASEKILSGTTRKLVLECIIDLGYRLELSHINRQQLPYLDESFITSVSRGILPIRKIDDFLLGDPGEITNSLKTHLDSKILSELADI